MKLRKTWTGTKKERTDKMEPINTEVGFKSFLIDGKELYFVRLNGNKLRVNERISKSGETRESFYDIPITDVSVDSLKDLELWESLTQELKDEIVKFDNSNIEEAKDRMEHARKHRRNKYPGVSDTVTCVNCNVEQKLAPSVIVARAEKIAKEKGIIFTPEDYCKGFVCQKCFPSRRGKKPSHNLPPKIELVCIRKCGKKVVYPASIVAKTIAKKGITLEQYVGNFVCQSCFPTKGRPKKSK
jgi:hypothetical protein